MLARRIAVLIGISLAGLFFGVGSWVCHRPTPMQAILVYASDPRGQPVARFGWTIEDETPGAMLYTTTPVATRAGGIAEVQGPVHEIMLEIESPGLRRVRLGPFRPDAIPSKLDVKLEDLGAVEGFVTLDGKPVTGAKVGLFRRECVPWSDDPSGLLYGFAEERGETDALGAFRIATDSSSDDLQVRAWKEGFAAGTTGPVRAGAPPIQVQLHAGGTLEGRLKLGPDRELKSCEVELYRADSGARAPDTFERFFARVDLAGAFVFGHVDTGPWLVRLKSREREASPDTVPFLVSIEEDMTCRLEMDLTKLPLELVGQFTMNGRPWSPAWPALYSTGERTLRLDSAEADSNGTWMLRARTPGRYQLFIWGNHEHDTSVPARAWGKVELLQGRTRFERALEWSAKDPPEVQLDQGR